MGIEFEVSADDAARIERIRAAVIELAHEGDKDALYVCTEENSDMKYRAFLNAAIQPDSWMANRIKGSFPHIEDFVGLIERVRIRAVLLRLEE